MPRPQVFPPGAVLAGVGRTARVPSALVTDRRNSATTMTSGAGARSLSIVGASLVRLIQASSRIAGGSPARPSDLVADNSAGDGEHTQSTSNGRQAHRCQDESLASPCLAAHGTSGRAARFQATSIHVDSSQGFTAVGCLERDGVGRWQRRCGSWSRQSYPAATVTAVGGCTSREPQEIT
jgi:hypothetical protein